MSSPRSGFVLDAKSMGLQRGSRPPSPSTSCVCEPEPTRQQEECQNVDTASSCTPTEVLARSGESQLDACASYPQCNSRAETLPTEYYRGLLQKLTQENGDAGQVNFELNSIFLKRLGEIDGLNEKGQGDTMFSTQLRLVTFQEWVDFLLNVNSVILGNMSDLEDEAYSKIVSYFNSMQGQQQQALEENRKLRRDLCTLIKFVQTGYHRSSWEGIKEVSLETLTVNQLLGMTPGQVLPESESEKMAECMKSLVNEMAEKHDEICHLKTQLSTLDEVVLTARQKLLLKDQCIAQLNQQLQEVTQNLANMPQQTTSAEVSSANLESASGSGESRVDAAASASITSCMLQDLTIQNFRETEMMRTLDAELNQFLILHNIHEHQTMEAWRRRFNSLYAKLSSERDDTMSKLESIRSQLSLLQSDLDRSGVAFNHPPPSAFDVDSKMVECLRERLATLSKCNRELQQKFMRRDTESNINISVLQTKLEFASGINERNSQIFKEIADLICQLSHKDFAYNDVYLESSTENPFCEAIQTLFEQETKQKSEDLSTCKGDTKTPSQTGKESAKGKPFAVMAKAKSTTKPTTKPATKPTTTTTTKPRSSK